MKRYVVIFVLLCCLITNDRKLSAEKGQLLAPIAEFLIEPSVCFYPASAGSCLCGVVINLVEKKQLDLAALYYLQASPQDQCCIQRELANPDLGLYFAGNAILQGAATSFSCWFNSFCSNSSVAGSLFTFYLKMKAFHYHALFALHPDTADSALLCQLVEEILGYNGDKNILFTMLTNLAQTADSAEPIHRLLCCIPADQFDALVLEWFEAILCESGINHARMLACLLSIDNEYCDAGKRLMTTLCCQGPAKIACILAQAVAIYMEEILHDADEATKIAKFPFDENTCYASGADYANSCLPSIAVCLCQTGNFSTVSLILDALPHASPLFVEVMRQLQDVPGCLDKILGSGYASCDIGLFDCDDLSIRETVLAQILAIFAQAPDKACVITVLDRFNCSEQGRIEVLCELLVSMIKKNSPFQSLVWVLEVLHEDYLFSSLFGSIVCCWFSQLACLPTVSPDKLLACLMLAVAPVADEAINVGERVAQALCCCPDVDFTELLTSAFEIVFTQNADKLPDLSGACQ